MDSPISVHRSATWAGLTQLAKVGTQLIGMLVLVRYLEPADYGLMAIAAAITTFASLFRDMGTAASIIQKSTLTPSLVSTVFWFNIFLGTLIGLFVAIISPWAGLFFLQKQLPNVLLALSPVFIFIAFGSVHQALLERESNFKAIAIVEIASACVALAAAVVLAVVGAGVYALVIQSLTAAVISTAMLWIIKSWRPVFNFNSQNIGEIWKFSGNIFLFNITNYFQRNADTAAIGRFLGSAELGWYNLAYRILLFPLQSITFVISRVSFPAYSRHQNNKPELAKHYLHTLQNIALITAPLMTATWLVRDPFVDAVFGDNWHPVAEVIFWLAPVGFLQSMVSTSGSLLSAVGQTYKLRNLGVLSLLFLVAPLLGGLPWGIQGVAAGYFVGNLMWTYPVFRTVLKELDHNYLDFIKFIYRPLLIALLSAIPTHLIVSVWYEREIFALVRLSANSLIYLGIYIFAIRAFCPKVWGQFMCDVTGKPVPSLPTHS